jgi:hypothetical protein
VTPRETFSGLDQVFGFAAPVVVVVRDVDGVEVGTDVVGPPVRLVLQAAKRSTVAVRTAPRVTGARVAREPPDGIFQTVLHGGWEFGPRPDNGPI